MSAIRIVLFDIDGTLLSTQGLGAEALIGAVRDVYGVTTPPPGYSMAGKTDSLIVRELASAGGVPEDRMLRERPRALARSAELLEAGFRSRPRGRLKPGIRALVDRMRTDAGFRLGLLTGNTRAGARHKVGHFGLWGHFCATGMDDPADGVLGAFGDEEEDRNALSPIALRRARAAFGDGLRPEDCLVVGDTVRDIACARAGGMKAVAVATGGDRRETLAAQAPDLLFHTLEDTDAVVRAFRGA